MKKLYKVFPSRNFYGCNVELSCLADNKEEVMEIAKSHFEKTQFPLEIEELDINLTQIITIANMGG